MPAALSTTITSSGTSSCEKACTRPTCCCGSSSVMCRLPEAAGTISRPLGPCSTVSRSSQRPAKTSARVKRGDRPSITSTLARPMSVSSSKVRWPALTSEAARLMETEVLPTPPLPLATAMTRGTATPSPALSHAPLAPGWAGLESGERMAVLGGQGVNGSTGGFLQSGRQVGRQGRRIGGLKVLRDLLAGAGVGQRQALVGQDRQGGAGAPGLV